MHYESECALQARASVEAQDEEREVMLCKMLENLLYFSEVAGGASNARIMQIARLG